MKNKEKYQKQLAEKLPHINVITFLDKNKALFYCDKHNQEFTKNVYHCLNSKGCKQCAKESYEKNKSLGWEVILSRFIKAHDSKYIYNKPSKENIKVTDKIDIICPKHGIFSQTIYTHQTGIGCPRCGDEKTSQKLKYTFEEWENILSEIHDNRYIYHNEFKNKKMKIECSEHGYFWQNPAIHKQGHGCPNCAKANCKITKPLTTKEWIYRARKIWGDRWDYSQVHYIDAKQKIKIICDKHGPFLQSPNDHLNGCGCRKCHAKSSKAEDEIVTFLKSLNVKIHRHNRTVLYPQEIDIFLPEYDLAIEFNGLYWHSYDSKNENKYYHFNKTQQSLNKNINLMHICEYDWLKNKQIVLSLISRKLGKTKKTFHNHDCIVEELSTQNSKLFVKNNSLQSYTPSTVKLGLKHKQSNELLNVMLFTKMRNDTWKLTNFTSKIDTHVSDGDYNLFYYFQQYYNPKQVSLSICRDYPCFLNIDKLGFEFEKTSKPDYFWVKKSRKYPRKSIKSSHNSKILTTNELFSKNFRRFWNSGYSQFLWQR